ncbi:hypothetical protein FDP41_012939 [Naegleria fowleri]|uniref:Uncharacterized protein n=1 Tax=Naegleria fowleri TaxID=5763 RepID=A0A6A5C295_NAEFO|nr:uncharacterized protein FDP41_012939 [Naegleria fowleri]KAF0981151.1 hypothetical protein FDP41_012939 [Naegleria fowleri]CAG4717136.1 unnamed protein product [Naegleria fowleri]
MQDQDKRIEGLTQRFQNISATLEDLNREVKQSLGKKEVGPSDDSGKTTTSGCCTVSDHQPLPGQEALKIGSSSTTDHEEERTPTTPTDENEERQLSPHEALCDAAYNGDLDVIRKVLSERENRYLVNEFLNFDEVLGEMTPFMYAAVKGQIEALNLFFELARPIVNLPDFEGDTPLILATNSKQYDVMKLLIDKGSNINHMDENGMSALHVAASNGDILAVKILLEKGADKNQATRGSTDTADMIAEMYGHSTVAQFIRDFKK